jgi:hypothetical protein
MSLCLVGAVPFGIAAFITGLIGRRQAQESAGVRGGEGLALAGMILGVLGVLIAITILVLVAILALNE